MKNKKGFTLIELLAVIVILAIIMVIAVPKILDVIENSRKTAAIESAQFFVDAVNKSNQFASTSLSSDYELYRDGKYNVSNVKNTLKLKNTWPSDNSTFLSCDGKWCSVTNSECENINYTYTRFFWYDASTDGYTLNNGWYTTLNPNSKAYRRTDGITPEVCGVFQNGTVCMTSSYYNSDYSSVGNYDSDFSDVTTKNISTAAELQTTGLKGYAKTKAQEMLSKGASSCYVDSNASNRNVNCNMASGGRCIIFFSGAVACSGDSGSRVYVYRNGTTD